MDTEPHVKTTIFDTQAGFEHFWTGLKREGFRKVKVLYHGRTRRWKVETVCEGLDDPERLQKLEQEAKNMEEAAQHLERTVYPPKPWED
jgi:hypothetical protein